MAEVKVSKQGGEKQLQRRGEGGLARWGEYFPPLFSLSPREFFSTSPFTLMRRITEDIDRAFSNFWGTSWAEEAALWMPPIEVTERDGKMKVSAELPGISKDDLKVEVSDGSLVIEGERKHEKEEKREGVYRSERNYGHFCRSIPLPEEAKIDEAQAEFKNGILEVTIPVPETARKARQVPIQTAEEETTKKVQAA